MIGLEPLCEKWQSFGWHVVECNGNHIVEILEAFRQTRSVIGKPTLIIAKTLMGKGVRSIENDYRWHGRVPSRDQAAGFISELENRKI